MSIKSLLQIKLVLYILLLILVTTSFINNIAHSQNLSNFNILGMNIPIIINGNMGTNFNDFNIINDSTEIDLNNNNIKDIVVNYASSSITTNYHDYDTNNIMIQIDGNSNIDVGYKIAKNSLIISSNSEATNYFGRTAIYEPNLTILIPKNAENNLLDYNINTASSEIDFNINSNNLDINCVSSEINIAGETKYLTLNFVSSNVNFVCTDMTDDIEINSVSGNINMIDNSSNNLDIDISNLSGTFKNNSIANKENSNKDVNIKIKNLSGNFIIQ